ncbi:hypothetical protein [Microbacterium maritypicum]
MSVEIHLGYQDHHKMEDFLASGAPGVGAITLHATGAKHQHGAADAARDAGVSVLYDPRTERLAYDDPSGATQKLPGWTGQVVDIGRLSSSIDDRARLVNAVIAGHPNEVTIVTPPSFYVTDERTSLLNVHLAEATRLATALPVRARVILSSRMPLDLVADLGREYRAAGITSVDLRVSPLNGEKDGIRKISKVFKTADAFRNSGIEVSLGNSGNVGQVAYALGHAESFSVGIGENERVDHAGRMSRQVTPPPPKYDENGRKVGGGGGWEGIYLPGLAATVGRKVGEVLLANTDIRTRISCRIGSCGMSIAGPLSDPRGHYLHARASEVSALTAKPTQWRAASELDRLARALELRQLVNESYQSGPVRALNTRTLQSLVEGINRERAAA